MGQVYSPTLANIYILDYENKYLNNSQHQKFILETSYRYIDDLIAINGKKDVEKRLYNLYPPFLKFYKSNNSSSDGNYLDLYVNTNEENNKRSNHIYKVCGSSKHTSNKHSKLH